MAEQKKSVLLYCDIIHTVEKLDDATAGELFKHYLRYINDKDPETDNLIVELCFEPIKQQLKRDLKKWETTLEGRSKAGLASAEARRNKKEQTATNPTNVKFVEQTATNPTVKDNVNVTVNVKDNVNVKEINNLDSRKLKFSHLLKPFISEFGEKMLREFFDYWTEHNQDGQKMRFEYSKNQPFNVSRRLGTWKRKNEADDFKSSTKKRGDGIDAEYMAELKNRINN